MKESSRAIKHHDYQPDFPLSTFKALIRAILSLVVFLLSLTYWEALLRPFITAWTAPNSYLSAPLAYIVSFLICYILLPLTPLYYLLVSIMGSFSMFTRMTSGLKKTKGKVVDVFNKKLFSSGSSTAASAAPAPGVQKDVTPKPEATAVVAEAPVEKTKTVEVSIPEATPETAALAVQGAVEATITETEKTEVAMETIATPELIVSAPEPEIVGEASIVEPVAPAPESEAVDEVSVPEPEVETVSIQEPEVEATKATIAEPEIAVIAPEVPIPGSDVLKVSVPEIKAIEVSAPEPGVLATEAPKPDVAQIAQLAMFPTLAMFAMPEPEVFQAAVVEPKVIEEAPTVEPVAETVSVTEPETIEEVAITESVETVAIVESEVEVSVPEPEIAIPESEVETAITLPELEAVEASIPEPETEIVSFQVEEVAIPETEVIEITLLESEVEEVTEEIIEDVTETPLPEPEAAVEIAKEIVEEVAEEEVVEVETPVVEKIEIVQTPFNAAMLPRFMSQTYPVEEVTEVLPLSVQTPFNAAMLPRFMSQTYPVEEVTEVLPLNVQFRTIIAPTEFVEPMVTGSIMTDEEELAALLENVKTQAPETKQLCSCHSAESLSSSYRDSPDASTSSSDNGEDIESNTEEVPVESETEAAAEAQSTPACEAPERPASCPPMGISQKHSIREIRDPRLREIRTWAQQSGSLAMAEEPSTSSDSEFHSEGDYDDDLASPPLSPISSSGGNDSEWSSELKVEDLDKMETAVEVETAEEVKIEEVKVAAEEVNVEEVKIADEEIKVEEVKIDEEVKSVIEAKIEVSEVAMDVASKDELVLPAAPLEVEVREVEVVIPELPTIIAAEKAEEIISIQEISEPAPVEKPVVAVEVLPVPVEEQEVEAEKTIITMPEAVKPKAIQVQKKKRKLPMKTRLINSRKRASKKN